jgi:uncharacterized membrane protein
MQRLMKFLHTMGAIGMMGAMACLLVLLTHLPEPAALAEYARMRAAMDGIARWVFLPSLAITVATGLLALSLNRGYHNAGWALVKLATGVLIFEGGLMAVQGPLQNEAELAARALAGEIETAVLGATRGPEWNSLWVMMGVATANVVLGVWRPRFARRKAPAGPPA